MTSAETGIIPLLNMHDPEFKDNPITSMYTSVITSVRGWVLVSKGWIGGSGCRDAHPLPCLH